MEFGKCVVALRDLLDQDRSSQMILNMLFIENHFYVLQMAYVRWKRKPEHIRSKFSWQLRRRIMFTRAARYSHGEISGDSDQLCQSFLGLSSCLLSNSSRKKSVVSPGATILSAPSTLSTLSVNAPIDSRQAHGPWVFVGRN